jgi:hypothetical protein
LAFKFFRVTNRGSARAKFIGLIVAVGENYGIGKISGVEVEGRIAQMIKRLIHLRYVYEIAGLGEVLKETLENKTWASRPAGTLPYSSHLNSTTNKLLQFSYSFPHDFEELLS